MSHLFPKELKRSNYRILGLVGQGQFGRVYCASHRKTGRLVALKELDKYRFPTHKFLRELRFLISLQHPNIVNCHALEHTLTGRYLVMDYCDGGTLRNLLEEDVRLHPAQALKLMIDVLSGLDHAHSRGIIHCDIKPENILLSLKANGWTARISDFGIAHLSQELARERGSKTGSPAYMAPERFYGQYSYSSDLYAVGILLFELLAGYRPFSGAPIELMSAHMNQPVRLPATIPPSLQSIILTALQKLPARRFRSTTDMLKAVQAAAAELYPAISDDTRLLQPVLPLPIGPYQALYQEKLLTEVRQLVSVRQGRSTAAPVAKAQPKQERKALTEELPEPAEDWIYRVASDRIELQVDWRNRESDPQQCLGAWKQWPWNAVQLPEPIQELMVCSQRCFAVTARSLYQLPAVLFQAPLPSQTLSKNLPGARSNIAISPDRSPSAPQVIATFTSNYVAALEAQGRWIATATLETNSPRRTLSVWRLPGQNLTRISLDRPPNSHLFQLLALDSRYLAAFSHVSDRQTARIAGVLLEVFTRRGQPVGSLHLPIPLHCVVAGPTPYRLIAIEPEHPTSVLLIDLKPLRMLRVGLEIAPVLLATASWGYVLVDAAGEIEFLNQYGERLGRIQGPASPTAITVLDPDGLLIATWKQGQGDLHTIDLRQLDMSMVF